MSRPWRYGRDLAVLWRRTRPEDIASSVDHGGRDALEDEVAEVVLDDRLSGSCRPGFGTGQHLLQLAFGDDQGEVVPVGRKGGFTASVPIGLPPKAAVEALEPGTEHGPPGRGEHPRGRQ